MLSYESLLMYDRTDHKKRNIVNRCKKNMSREDAICTWATPWENMPLGNAQTAYLLTQSFDPVEYTDT